MKAFNIFLLLALLFPLISQGNEEQPWPAGFVFAEDQSEGWEALPRGRAFPVLPSDPRDLRLGLRKNSQRQLEADVAGYRSVAGWKGDLFGEKTLFTTGIEGAGFFQMRQEGSKFPLESSDGLVGIYAEAAQSLWMYQLRFTHISAHLSDGALAGRSAFVYTREFLSLRVARQLGFVRPYVGYHYLVHVAPAVPKHTLQLGAYSILPWHWGIVHPYLGADLRLRNAEEGTTYQLGAGAALVSKSGLPPLRILAQYQEGHDLRGQYFREKLKKWTFGLELDI